MDARSGQTAPVAVVLCHERKRQLILLAVRLSSPFYGSPAISLGEEAEILLPSRHERFHQLGPAFLPPYSKGHYRVLKPRTGQLSEI